MANINITADNLPKDSGNRYYMAPYDPVASAYSLPLAYPISGAFGGLAHGHISNAIVDTMTATATLSSGVDLGGYYSWGLIVPVMGSGCNLVFQVSGQGQAWSTVGNTAASIYSATGLNNVSYAMSQEVLNHVSFYRWVRISATVLQTATRSFTWQVMS